jgi:N,N'-diacetyllegionaminate synthase
MNFESGRCLIIGEVAQAHDGSLGTAHAYIDAVARAGADAVKFQTHIAEAESSPSEPWRVPFSYQDESRYAYWKRMEFTEPQWMELKSHAEERGLEFISSPFSVEAARLLSRIGVRTWKVASGEVTNSRLFDYLLETRLPIILSTGFSSITEIDAAMSRIKSASTSCAITQCTSIYPCPPEKVGLNLIPVYRQRYECAVGLSDHSGTIFPGLAAAAMGIEVLEVHITFSRECFGPDVPASLTTTELKTLVEGVRFIQKMTTHAVNKDELSVEMLPTRKLFTKSLVAKMDLPEGTVLTPQCLVLRKPGTGIPEDRLASIIGRRLKSAVAAGELLKEAHVMEDSVPQHSHSPR